VNSVCAFNQGDAFLVSPRKPHPVPVAFSQHGHVEANAETAAQDRIVRVFAPAAAGVVGWSFIGCDCLERSGTQGRSD